MKHARFVTSLDCERTVGEMTALQSQGPKTSPGSIPGRGNFFWLLGPFQFDILPFGTEIDNRNDTGFEDAGV